MFRFIRTAAVVLLLVPAALHAQHQTKVTLTPVADEILAGDPLFLRIEVINEGNEPLLVYRTIGSSWGGDEVQIRAPGAAEFEHQRTELEGLQGAERPHPFALVPPGGVYAGYPVHFLNGPNSDAPTFGKPGKYELRVVVPIGTGANPGKNALSHATSPPITVTVKERPQAEMKLIDGSAEELSDVVIGPEGMNDRIESSKLGAIQEKLSDSELKKALEWSRLIIEAFNAPEAVERQHALQRLVDIRSKSDPIVSEVIGLVLGSKYVERRQWKEAKAVHETLKTRSYHSDNIKDVAEHALKQASE